MSSKALFPSLQESNVPCSSASPRSPPPPKPHNNQFPSSGSMKPKIWPHKLYPPHQHPSHLKETHLLQHTASILPMMPCCHGNWPTFEDWKSWKTTHTKSGNYLKKCWGKKKVSQIDLEESITKMSKVRKRMTKQSTLLEVTETRPKEWNNFTKCETWTERTNFTTQVTR